MYVFKLQGVLKLGYVVWTEFSLSIFKIIGGYDVLNQKDRLKIIYF